MTTSPHHNSYAQQLHLPGILGGMGAFAGVYFQLRLISILNSSGISHDQGYPDWIFLNASSIPDRATSPNECTSKLIEFGHTLERSGADFIVVTCNAAHAYRSAVQQALKVPWIDLPKLVSRELLLRSAAIGRIAILGTNAAVRSSIYSTILQATGFTTITPEINDDIQSALMDAIHHPNYGIKATGATATEQALEKIALAVEWCKRSEADAILIACTELSTIASQISSDKIIIVDPLEILARTTIALMYGHSNFDEDGNVSYGHRSPMSIEVKFQTHDVIT